MANVRNGAARVVPHTVSCAAWSMRPTQHGIKQHLALRRAAGAVNKVFARYQSFRDAAAFMKAAATCCFEEEELPVARLFVD